MKEFQAEKELASQLRKLTRQVQQLRDEIRGGALPTGNRQKTPSLPTEPERRLRLVSSNDLKKRA